jgi:2-pyrone-4,6-dicarboxylate lactonase
MQLSNGGFRDDGPLHPWVAAIPSGQAYHAAAPDRCIWGTDWPHVAYNRRQFPWPADAGLADLLRQYVPDDTACRKVLVDTPARLYGFSPPS